MSRNMLPLGVMNRWIVMTVILGLGWCMWAELGYADPEQPGAGDHKVVRTVSIVLSKEHLSQHRLDDEISTRAFKQFLEDLDRMKVYFTQEDVDGFLKHERELDDMVRGGDVGFAYEVFKVFLQRVDERVLLIDQLLDEQRTTLNFDEDESMVIDPKAARYARDPGEVIDLWRKRVKYDLLLLETNSNVTGKAARDRLRRRYHSFAKWMHQTTQDELLERYLNAVTSSYDPHTSFMSGETLENFEMQLRLHLDGIGASLKFEDGYTVVNELVPGGAAAREGSLQVKDRIVAVAQGEEGPFEDTVEMKLNDVVKRIRGKKGTIVRIRVEREGEGAPIDILITRDKIMLTNSEARGKVFEVGQKRNGEPLRVGVLDLPSFYMDMDAARRGVKDFKSCTRDCQRVLSEFKREGVDAVVMDLRKNGGGSLTEAINLTGLFIDEGPVVQVKGVNDRNPQVYADEDGGTLWEGPLVVLISKFSASASEIFAGAIQDYQRGLIVGDTATHGKGTVQTLMDLGDRLPGVNGAIKLTMQQFYRPNGDSTQNRGVEADIVLPSITSYLKGISESDLDYAREFDQVKSAQFNTTGHLERTIVPQLQERSKKRCATAEGFQKVARDIARYEEQRDRQSVILVREKFLAERAELNAEREQEKRIEEASSGTTEIKRDYYLDEVFQITLDFMQAANVARAR